MKYQRLLNEIKIDKILDIILTDTKSKQFLTISRIDCFNVNFYFRIDDNKTVYFKVFNPSIYGINLLKQKEIESNEIEY